MAETYHFVWGEVPALIKAMELAEQIEDIVDYAHLETEEYDLDMDRTAIRIRIPHDPVLTEERKGI